MNVEQRRHAISFTAAELELVRTCVETQRQITADVDTPDGELEQQRIVRLLNRIDREVRVFRRGRNR